MEIQRWGLAGGWNCDECEIATHDTGDYVLYSDHAKRIAALEAEVAEVRDFHLACLKDAYAQLGIDGSDGEYRYKWVGLEISKVTDELATLRQQLEAARAEIERLRKYQCRHPNTITNGTDYRCSSCQKEMTREEWLELVDEERVKELEVELRQATLLADKYQQELTHASK